MTAPYVVVAWPAASQDASDAAACVGQRLSDGAWRIRVEARGLTVWERPERPLPSVVHDENAVVIGRRFGSDGFNNRPGAGGGRADSLASRARALSRSGWGAYIAFLHDDASDRWWVFRDPSGALEAYSWTLGPLTLCGSGPAGLPSGLGPTRLGLDWIMVSELLRNPAVRGGRPALAGFEWVAPGDLQPLAAGRDEAIAIWRPAQWAQAGQPDGDIGEQLRETLVGTVTSLAAPYDRVVTEASGGLDSSIVNAAMANAGLTDKITAALHYVADRPEADEQRWASELCARWNLPLASVDRLRPVLNLDTDFGGMARGVRPPFAALDVARDRDTAERLDRWDAQALMTGKGGDALFFQMPTPLVLADLWKAKGLAALRDPLNAQVARWLRRSVWDAWRDAARPDASSASIAPLARFAGPTLWKAPSAAPHPWLSELDEVPPAKRVQIRAITNGQVTQTTHRRSQTVDMLHPLLTQPMLELGLSIPAWELVEGGRERALARRAFAAWLPDSVVRRRSKAGLHSWYARIMAINAPAVRAHLIDGVLADAGLLDRAAMAHALEPDELMRDARGVDLMAAVAIESWVRYWQTRVPDSSGRERPRW